MKIVCVKCPRILKPLLKIIFKKQLKGWRYR